jgi:hypothetical protein
MFSKAFASPQHGFPAAASSSDPLDPSSSMLDILDFIVNCNLRFLAESDDFDNSLTARTASDADFSAASAGSGRSSDYK